MRNAREVRLLEDIGEDRVGMSRRVSASSQQLDQNAAFELSGSPSSSLPKRLPSTIEECVTPKSQHTTQAHIMSAKETILRFLLLPKEVLIVLLLEFLNSFRSFGLRFVLYQYVTNEFELGDTQAGAVLGVKGIGGCMTVTDLSLACNLAHWSSLHNSRHNFRPYWFNSGGHPRGEEDFVDRNDGVDRREDAVGVREVERCPILCTVLLFPLRRCSAVRGALQGRS